MHVVGDVKCYHCGHISGQVEGSRTERLVLHAFKPRPGYQGEVPGPGQRLRCERCQGPVYLEDLHPAPPQQEPIMLPTKKRARSSRSQAA
ncbi:MAG: hypothetical protein WEE64_12900 [Dehalococcoidia bacterium]